MSWDLATILVALMVISGIIWLYDKWQLAPQRAAKAANLTKNANQADRLEVNRLPFIIDLARSLFPVFLIVLLLRSFLIEPFRIPSSSMMPTLLAGDFILVNKYSYGLRLPVVNTKIMSIGEPQRGDVVVFHYPKHDEPATPYGTPFIKRIVGLPGDHIVYHTTNKMLYINGEPITQDIVGIFQGIGSGSDMTGREQRIEHLSGKEHAILVMPGSPIPVPISDITIPERHYFVLGDNRDNSRDSRYWGMVPEEELIGKAFFIWMNWDLASGGISWKRLGTVIH